MFSSTFYAGFTTLMFGKSILEMVGEEHRRYRALVQPAFSPKRAQWWIDRWIASIVDEAVSGFEERVRRVERGVVLRGSRCRRSR